MTHPPVSRVRRAPALPGAHAGGPATTPARDVAPGIIRPIRTAVAREFVRCRTETLSCASGVVAGALPHVLHHAGPLAGAALVAGAGGQLLFGALGLLAMIPLLWRLHRRKGGWRAPAWALTAFVALFAMSTLVLGPLLADLTQPDSHPVQPVEVDGHDHDS